MTVERTVRLRFTPASRRALTHTNLSAVRSDGRVLWVAGDETATVERLIADDGLRPQEYAGQVTFRLADLVTLPGPYEDEEADIEGLARSGDFLWAVGSHSLRRKRIKAKHTGAKALDRLARVQRQANRQILVRVPVVEEEGLPALVRETVVAGEPVRAAVFGFPGYDLRDVLSGDEHLAPFLAIPGKDNGFDIEGIAVAGDRVYLGLRGPVLRGWAFVLELRPRVDALDPGRLALPAFPDGVVYRKHVLDLDGLGVRDLCPVGDDLLVLAGPTMTLDGPVRVYRWRGAARAEVPEVVRGEALVCEVDLPQGVRKDRAEGIGLLGPPDHLRLIVVYDNPSPARFAAEDTVLADVVVLPPA